MAGAIVQTKANQAAGSATTIASGNLDTNPTSGNVLWVVARSQGTTTMSIADSLGLTWTSHGSIAESPGTNSVLEHWTAPVTSSGACSVTVTYAAAQDNRGIFVAEVSGVGAVQGSDEDMSNGDLTTPLMSVAATAPAFALMAGNALQGGTITITGTAWTDVGFFWSPTVTGLRVGSQVISASGNVTGQFNTPSFDRATEAMIVFSESSSGPTYTVTETVTTSEVVALARQAGMSVSETATASDAVAMGRLLGLTLTESVTASDALSLAIGTGTGSGASLTETAECSDALALAVGIGLEIAESVTATDRLAGSFDPAPEPRVPPVVPQWWRRHTKGGRLWRW